MTKKPDFFRKRPKQERSQDLVETVFSAAREVFNSKGIEKTTTNQIAERAGISIGSLYRYFPNKESIVSALIENQLSQHLKALNAVLEVTDGLTDGEVVELAVNTLCNLYFDNVEFLNRLLKEQGRGQQVEVMVMKHLSFEKLIQSIHHKRGGGRSERFGPRVFVVVHAVMGVLHSVVELYPNIPDRKAVTNQTVIMAKKYLLPWEETHGI